MELHDYVYVCACTLFYFLFFFKKHTNLKGKDEGQSSNDY